MWWKTINSWKLKRWSVFPQIIHRYVCPSSNKIILGLGLFCFFRSRSHNRSLLLVFFIHSVFYQLKGSPSEQARFPWKSERREKCSSTGRKTTIFPLFELFGSRRLLPFMAMSHCMNNLCVLHSVLYSVPWCGFPAALRLSLALHVLLSNAHVWTVLSNSTGNFNTFILILWNQPPTNILYRNIVGKTALTCYTAKCPSRIRLMGCIFITFTHTLLPWTHP